MGPNKTGLSGVNTVLGIIFTGVIGVISICKISQINVSQRFLGLFSGPN